MLLEGIRALSEDEQVKANARRLAAEFAGLGGPERAAETITQLVDPG
jgi:hypothetical protein